MSDDLKIEALAPKDDLFAKKDPSYRVYRGFWVSLASLNPLKHGELVQVFRSFTGNSEQLPYSPTIVDTPVCTFFDSVLEKVLERN